jgi:exoribonuclease-2
MIAVIYDGNSCKIGELIQQDKKTVQVHFYAELTAAQTDKNISHIKHSYLVYLAQSISHETRRAIVALASSIDMLLLWELSLELGSCSIHDLVDLYFGNNNQNINQQALALLIAIFDSQIYFSFNRQNLDNTTSSPCFKRHNLQELEQKKYQKEQREKQHNYLQQLYLSLLNYQRPSWNIDPITDLLYSPNKNALEYKAFIKASKELKIKPMDFLFKLGYIKSIDDYLIQQFYNQYYKAGDSLNLSLSFADISSLEYNQNVIAFSIDDANTTEIDDALSVQYMSNGNYLIGVHIATAALCQQSLAYASAKFSSVYFTGDKFTMLPNEIIRQYSLDENHILPVVSIYFEINDNMQILDYFTTLEKIKIHNNLRNEILDEVFNIENVDSRHIAHIDELKILYKLANKLSKDRGKPTANEFALEYNIIFDENGKIVVKQRQRNSALNKTVSELMILANCSWGKLLAKSFIPAIYRVKQGNNPVHSSSSPNSHSGLNVDYYTWATSPLRRSIDLINQIQIINLINQKKPLKPEDTNFANILNNFDEIYAQYINFQNKMETYWSLRYIEQEDLKKVSATFIYKYLVQVDGLPLKINLYDYHVKSQEVGSKIELLIKSINFEEQQLVIEVVNN